jgi:hypothetical protein
MINIRKRDTGLRKAVFNRFGWEASPMLDATKTLFLYSRN